MCWKWAGREAPLFLRAFPPPPPGRPPAVGRPARGIFSPPSHALTGQSYVGKILVLDTAKGGVATAWMLHEMQSRGIVPLALVFNRVNPILAQGAAFGGVTMVDRFDGDVTDLIRTGDRLRIDAAAGVVEILDRN